VIPRGLLIHGGVLLFSGVLALRTFTYDADKAPKHGESELWSGSPSQVQSIRFESKGGSIQLEPRQDSVGSYFIGTVKKNPNAEPKPADPHAPAETKPPEPEAATGPKTSRFIATKEGQELVESVAPLRALRVLGKLTDAQKTEFGLDKEEGKLFVKTNGEERALVFGGTTPGGSDYYAKDVKSGNAYVVSGGIFRDLTSADQRLIEHKLHAFEEGVPKRVKITTGSASRELVRSSEKKDAWTKASEPAGKDETATNWLSKVDRLRSTSYNGEKLDPPAAPADQVVRIEYFDDRRSIGFIELVRRKGEGDKPEYVAKTEYTRWYATVLRSSAEQLDSDLKSVVAP
jgi:hypothetical protein